MEELKGSKYQCQLCKKSFLQKIDLDRHMTKKNACVPIETVIEMQQENENLKKDIREKEKRNTMRANLTNLFKYCLDKLRDQEHLTGDKALRTIACLLVLRLSEEHMENGIDDPAHIDIDNMDHYDIKQWEEVDIRRYMTYARFSVLNNETEVDMVAKTKKLWDIILCEHPKFKDFFPVGDSFRIKHDSTFKNLITKIANFPFEDYDADIQGEAYEEILKDTMTGKILGQFFTPPLIKQFMVELINPQVKQDGTIETIYDLAMGTGGFLITALRHILKEAKDRNIKLDYDFITKQGLGGREAEPDTFRLCKANMLIASGHSFDTLECDDSIRNPIQKKYDIILANPPFGIKGLKYDDININGEIKKQDYMPIASNSAVPLFLQVMIYILNVEGRCATVVPDGQDLFSKSKNSVAIRELLLKSCDLREIIHMPGGVFNNTDIKTCVFYFVKKHQMNDVIEIVTKGKKTSYKFIEEHATDKVEFYTYDPFTKTKKLEVEVSIDKISTNEYSLNYNDYITKTDIDKDVFSKEITSFKLIDLVDFTKNGKTNTASITNTGEYPFYSASVNCPTGTHQNYDFDGNEYIVFIKSGGNSSAPIGINLGIGKVYYVKNKIAANIAVYQMKVKNENTNVKYLYYYLDHIQPIIQGLANYATNNGNIDMNKFKELKIPLPPLHIQKQLVQKLDTIYENIIPAFEKAMNGLKESNKLIMEHQVSCRNSEIKKLGDICEFIKKINTNIDEGKSEGKYPLFSSAKICKSFLDTFTYEQLCIIINTSNGAGKANLHISTNFSTTSDTLVFKSKNDITTNYIYNYFNYNLDILNTGFVGSNHKHISTTYLNKLLIPIPGIDTQKQIIKSVEENNKLMEKLQKNIEENKKLAEQIMADIFKSSTNNSDISNIWNEFEKILQNEGIHFDNSNIIKTQKSVNRTNKHYDQLIDIHNKLINIDTPIRETETIDKVNNEENDEDLEKEFEANLKTIFV